MKKLLIALQFFPGDQNAAMRLAKFMADLEPTHRKDADLVLFGRFDVKHDLDAVRYVSRRFNVATFTGRRQGVGWPAGCNDLWHDLIDYATENAEHKLAPSYDAILTCESDCVPLYPDWINRLSAAWESRTPGAIIAGCLCMNPQPHINGNLLLSGKLEDLQKVRRLRGSSSSMGWDYQHAAWFSKQGWAVIPEIVSWHSYQHWTDDCWDKLLGMGCVFFHGEKHGKSLATAREKLLGQKRFFGPKVTVLDARPS